MYENKYKNPISTGLKELEALLQLIGDLNTPLELFALGGTAMVLGNVKEATKDIDFMTLRPQEEIRKLFTLAGLKEVSDSKLCNIWYLGDIRVDIFYGDSIMGVALPNDWREHTTPLRTIGKVKLNMLGWIDIIITKIARTEPRDIEDCIDIINSKKIDVKKIQKRYEAIAETSLISNHKEKFEALRERLKHVNT